MNEQGLNGTVLDRESDDAPVRRRNPSVRTNAGGPVKGSVQLHRGRATVVEEFCSTLGLVAISGAAVRRCPQPGLLTRVEELAFDQLFT
jgi:hypothetical protein